VGENLFEKIKINFLINFQTFPQNFFFKIQPNLTIRYPLVLGTPGFLKVDWQLEIGGVCELPKLYPLVKTPSL